MLMKKKKILLAPIQAWQGRKLRSFGDACHWPAVCSVELVQDFGQPQTRVRSV